ncbi:unnamed protein product [Gadus morhua 'NCC']
METVRHAESKERFKDPFPPSERQTDTGGQGAGPTQALPPTRVHARYQCDEHALNRGEDPDGPLCVFDSVYAGARSLEFPTAETGTRGGNRGSTSRRRENNTTRVNHGNSDHHDMAEVGVDLRWGNAILPQQQQENGHSVWWTSLGSAASGSLRGQGAPTGTRGAPRPRLSPRADDRCGRK